MIDLGKSQIFKRQMPQALHGVVRRDLARAHLLEKFTDGFRVQSSTRQAVSDYHQLDQHDRQGARTFAGSAGRRAHRFRNGWPMIDFFSSAGPRAMVCRIGRSRRAPGFSALNWNLCFYFCFLLWNAASAEPSGRSFWPHQPFSNRLRKGGGEHSGSYVPQDS